MMILPRDPDPALKAHRESCVACDLYAQRMLSFETRLERGLRVAATSPAATSPALTSPAAAAPPRSAHRRRWFAMAASLLVASLVAAGLWVSTSGPSLAADVVTHMAEEPQAWRSTSVAVPERALQDVLRDSHLRLASDAGIVSYANACLFRGRRVPHVVVQTASGPVTVMVLVHERVSKRTPFDERGYRGVIVPVPGHGSLAVLTRDPSTDAPHVEAIARRVLDSIVWTG